MIYRVSAESSFTYDQYSSVVILYIMYTFQIEIYQKSRVASIFEKKNTEINIH